MCAFERKKKGIMKIIMFYEMIKFIVYSLLIVIISKYILVTTLRKLAENLNLKPKTVGNIAGLATSMPELLSISVSSLNGLISASIVNVLSSNIINFIQYIVSIFFNKNGKAFQNKAIKIDLFLVILTIFIPIGIMSVNMQINLSIVPIFILCYILFKFLNNNSHKLFLNEEQKFFENRIEEEQKWERNQKRKTIKNIICLIMTGILLFIISDALGDTLGNLCNNFNVSQTMVGIFLGVVTSIPELITFFESQKHYKSSKNDDILGVVEATNNLLTSNILNLFIIQSIGVVLFNLFSVTV